MDSVVTVEAGRRGPVRPPDGERRGQARPPSTRTERKQITRRALLDAALRLLEDGSFAALSLRQVAREAGVTPTAFYRHFDDLEQLGLVLVSESFGRLREMIRDARAELEPEHIVRRSAETLVRCVLEQRVHFRLLARERFSGVASLRQAIRAEFRLFASELATDLARFAPLDHWSTEDLGVLANLMVGAMISIAEAVLESPPAGPHEEQAAIDAAQKQLLMILVGARGWRS
jgi:AcrR family transcriptional regulator